MNGCCSKYKLVRNKRQLYNDVNPSQRSFAYHRQDSSGVVVGAAAVSKFKICRLRSSSSSISGTLAASACDLPTSVFQKKILPTNHAVSYAKPSAYKLIKRPSERQCPPNYSGISAVSTSVNLKKFSTGHATYAKPSAYKLIKRSSSQYSPRNSVTEVVEAKETRNSTGGHSVFVSRYRLTRAAPLSITTSKAPATSSPNSFPGRTTSRHRTLNKSCSSRHKDASSVPVLGTQQRNRFKWIKNCSSRPMPKRRASLASLCGLVRQALYCLRRPRRKREYCAFYNRFGRCSRGQACSYIHSPRKVVVCRRFLRGSCTVVGCVFSHDVCKEKMPVCAFFLKGFCANECCPYLHVKHGSSCGICEDFQAGVCSKGEQCDKVHRYIFNKTIKSKPVLNRDVTTTSSAQRLPIKFRRFLTESTLQLPEVNSVTDDQRKNGEDKLGKRPSFRSAPLPSFIALDSDDENHLD